ncbi:MAG: efflux RND transporter periplasmic adaptor subunit [Candidatus Cloacimonetes bacterium]|jgi:HlyD family secretion protein|nr:efflux RND transporter periplasmic adaptor subunit [Candidatus Syntrophosphaera sp.]NLA44952.1 efflux RND transporter periplasmic adaptor subunit [Candidatus Cloacimonadota bacterium]HOH82469.1 efflux RND transporter periplasmic adaptor subunit [Candidatus Syntrophosphaera thermopropionivorans]HOZ92047.1 efflux RND transporter periplasmic adaptor subunit [Candidatus Syntrophosphaera thermopropionivorans]HRD00164.1 efflux RND transporter periplasmic adaptor subunit [Candidatus Syntrophosphaer
MKKKYLTYIIIAVVVIAVIVVISQVNKKKNMPEWRTETPSSGTIREVVTATGSLNPTMLVEVGTEVSGKIEKLYKDFNDTVKKGELLAKLDTEILTANLESAKADVNKATIVRDDAKMEYENSKTLYEKGMGSQYEMEKKLYTYQQAEQNLATAILKLKTAQKNLQNASITSPINGVVVSREVSEGQTVAATMSSPTLFKIANNLDIMEITAVVDEADIGKVRVGMPVEFTVDAYPEEQFYGTVNQIRLKSIVEQNVVSYHVIIDTDNPEHKLLPGMTTNVTIIIQSKEDVMRIPVTATRFLPSKEVWELFGLKWEDNLITKARRAAMQAASSQNSAKTSTMNAGNKNFSNGRPKFSTIWVLKDNVPELMVVQTGISDGAYIEVLSDLDQKAKIITGVNYKNASQITGNSVMGGPRGGRF